MREYRKKLIEVGLPLVAINKESAREKSIRHGHPSTLHLWWARRPLAACRAVLFASLVDDPDSDPAYRKVNGSLDEERAGLKRADLFNLIEELVMWANSNNADIIRTARAEIARCVASRLIETGALTKDTAIGPNTTAYDLVIRGHCRPKPMGLDKKVGRVRFSFDVSRLPPVEAVNAFLAEHAPPVLDPFAGGGSIPLEAQRLGLRAYASDLNPVPVLINKALIEIPPKFAGRPPVNPAARVDGTVTKGKGKKSKKLVEHDWPGATGLAEDVRYYGQWMRDEAEKRIGHLYPKVEVTAEMGEDRSDLLPYVGQKLTVIAWIWARTVASPNPACGGAHTPLVRSFRLSTKEGKEAFAQPVVDRKTSTFRFRVVKGDAIEGFDPSVGTVSRKGAVCVFTQMPIPFTHIRQEGKNNRLRSKLMAVVAECSVGRIYLDPHDLHEQIALDAKAMWRPEFEISHWPGRTNVVEYGLDQFDKLFTERQLSAMATFSELVAEARLKILNDAAAERLPDDNKSLAESGNCATAYADAVATYLALGVDKIADYNCSLVAWINQRDQAGHAMTKQALPMVWDFAEVNPLIGAAGDITISLRGIARVISNSLSDALGYARQLDATATLDEVVSPMVSTDPPYYDNIGYANLADFFYVWLRRSLSGVFPSLFSTVLTPKATELIASPYRHEGSKERAQAFFEFPSTEFRLILVIFGEFEYFGRHDGGIKASQRMFSVC